MTESGPYIDPRALEVLYDVVRDPNSTLLRMKRPRAFSAGLGNGTAEIVTSAAGNTNAEKELLRVYREETAYLLRVAYFERSQRPRPENEKGLIAFKQRNRESELGDEALVRRMQNLGAWATGDGDPSLSSAVEALTHPQTSLLSLACLSQRIAPSASALSYVVDEHLMAEEGASALVVCRQGLGRSLTTSWRSLLMAKLSTAYSLVGDSHSAMECQRKDVLESALNVHSALNWGLQSVKCADRGATREALDFLDKHWASRTIESVQWIELCTQQMREMPPTLDRDALALARSLLPFVGEVGGDLLRLVLHGATDEELALMAMIKAKHGVSEQGGPQSARSAGQATSLTDP